MSGQAHDDDDDDGGASVEDEEQVSVEEGGVGDGLSFPSPPCEVRPVDIEWMVEWV